MSINGQYCRYQIPITPQEIILNNNLEYIKEIITIWVDIIEGHMENKDCVLDLSVSYRAIIRNFKSNFDKVKQSAIVIDASKPANIVINTEI